VTGPAEFVLMATLKATLVLVVAAALDALLPRLSAAARHLVWMAALAAAVSVPLLSAVMPRWEMPVLPGEDAVRVPVGARARHQETGFSPAERERPADVRPAGATSAGRSDVGVLSVGVDGLAVALWLAGAAVVLLPPVIGTVMMWRLCRRARAAEGADWSLLRRTAGRVGLRRLPRLLVSERVPMPMTFGVLRPAILLPTSVVEWPESRREAVLAHELAHIHRFDCLTHALAQAALAAYWFHPMAWMALRRMRAEREKACDDLVLAAGARDVDYAQHLLDVARTIVPARSALAAMAMARPSQLEGRLLSILDARRDRRVVGRAGTVAAAAIALSLVMPLAAAHPVPQLAPTPQPEASPAAAPRPQGAPVLDVRRPVTAQQPRPTPTARPAPVVNRDPGPDPNPSAAPDSHPVDAAVVDALLTALGDADEDVRAQAAATLGDLHAPGAAPALLRALGDAQPAVRQQAARSLGELRTAEAVEPLVRLAGDADVDVRGTAIMALGEIADPRAAPAVSRALADADADVRAAAARALGEMRHAPDAGAIAAALRDSDPGVRRAAAHALGEIGERAHVPALIDAARDKEAEVRRDALHALGEIGDRRALAAVTAAMKDVEAEVRRAAIRALGAIASEDQSVPQ
jgi:beta-lactamase regulating signal transducer with metallopeptidase domain/vesicle coat complex subunit